MNGCIDNWILNRYWTDELHAAVCASAPYWTDPMHCLREYRAIVESALDADALADFYFDAACAKAFCTVYKTPFYVHIGYNILYYAAEHVRSHGTRPTATPGVPFDPADWEFQEWQTPEQRDAEGVRGPDWNPAKTSSERKVETCPHQAIVACKRSTLRSTPDASCRNDQSRVCNCRAGNCQQLPLRPGLKHRAPLVELLAPMCMDCGARVMCSCVSADFVRQFGASHAVFGFASSGPSRDGAGSVGFKPGMCHICCPRRTVPPNDRGFRDVYALLFAARWCLTEEPALYRYMFSGWQTRLEKARTQRLVQLFPQIVAGKDTRLLREEFERQFPPSVVFRADAFRPYFNRARSLFRQLYGLPGINEGWVSETTMLEIVRSLFPAERVMDHYRPPWLDGLELDVYLPNRRLAFEYMGIQHFQPVERFGGMEAFASRLERDRRKRTICEARGIRLIDVRYDEPLTIDTIRMKYITLQDG